MSGFYLCCNCCGHEFNGPVGASRFIEHTAQQTYYGVRISPEATWDMSARAREFLIEVGRPDVTTYQEWIEKYYQDWKPSGPDVIPVAYAWLSFAELPKSPEYQAWRKAHGIIV